MSLLALQKNIPETCDPDIFSDVGTTFPNDWTCKYTTFAANEKRITTSMDTFRPQEPISRVEALAFLLYPRCGDVVYERDRDKYNFQQPLQDWQKRVLVTALNSSVIPEIDGTDWTQPVSREEFFWWTHKVFVSGVRSCFFVRPITYYHDTKGFDKIIKVDTFREVLHLYENGKRIESMIISSGNNDHATPSGRFRISNKHEKMLSKSTGLWMPYWMEFFEGTYGFHALPVTYDGTPVRDESVLGRSANGGCVRLSEKNAQKLYNWAENGTTVLIHYNDGYQP